MSFCKISLSVLVLLVTTVSPPECVFAAEPANALATLGKQRRILESAVKKGDFDAARTAIEAIGKLDSPKGVQYLLLLAHIRPAELYLEVVRAIPGSRNDAMREMLVSLYRTESRKNSSDWEKRVMLLDALATASDEDVVPVFEIAVDDPHPKVRLAAIRRLNDSAVPTVSKVPLWIDSLSAAETALDVGTPHIEARKHLFQVTAQDFNDAKSWTRYWQDRGSSYRTPEAPPEGSIRLESEAQYYGEAVTSRRVLFIVDISGSMNIFEQEGWPDVPQVPPGGTANTGADGGGSPITNPLLLRWIEMNPLSVRMARAKAELTRLIDQLPTNTFFNIIAFNSQTLAWQKTLTLVGPQSVESARQFVASLRDGGATAADLALASAFKDNNLADTIYFLSDGEPSRDGINALPVAPLLEQVQEANRFHRIIINTVGFGEEGALFMKALAEQNAGTYRQIIGPPAW
jgi:hypothetical protein